MIMKCKKISGIEKSVCTCEQKIAYNYAFAWRETFIRRTTNATEIQKQEALQDIIDFIIKDVSNRDDMKKYNPDAIIASFRQGFQKYVDRFFIASSYEQIGSVFIIPYTIK